MEILSYIKTTILENDFASGGLIIGSMSYLVYMARSLPGHLWNWFLKMTTVTVEVPDRYDSFKWFVAWSKEQSSLLRVDNYTLSEESDLAKPRKRRIWKRAGSLVTNAVLFPLNVKQVFLYERKLVIVGVDRQQLSQGSQSDRFFHDKLTVTLFPGTKSDLNRLVEYVHKSYKVDQSGFVDIMVNSYDYWRKTTSARKRSPDTVCFKEGFTESILGDMESFLNSQDWYQSRGIPWRRGYFFSGPPGNGKSTMALCIASHLELSLCFLNLSVCDESDLQMLLNDAPANALIVLEDVDCMKAPVQDRSNDEESLDKSRITLSTLLNSLDGVGAQEGRILIMTSNHMEKLDPALVRPGRIDRVIKFENPDVSTAIRMYDKFFPNSSDELRTRFGEQIDGSHSSATIQSHFLAYRHDQESAALNPISKGFAKKASSMTHEFAQTS